MLAAQSQTYAQDGSPDFYNNTLVIEGGEEEYAEEVTTEDYFYEDQYYNEDVQYYEEEVDEDTSSVSMLTFNFLFYIVYKLKFEDADQKQDTQKTADD